MTRNPRIGIVHAALATLALAVLAKAAHVQLVQGNAWAKAAVRQQFSAKEVPAPRGRILDASEHTLATSREVVRLEIAPREARDLRKLRKAMLSAGIDGAIATRSTDTRRAWFTMPGRYIAEDVAEITAMRGVYTTPLSERAYASSAGMRALIGRVDAQGNGTDGLELALDGVLRGESGASRMMRDVKGRNFASPSQPGSAAKPGQTVVLTINHELQEIAERTLKDAVARMSAEGGDIVILDPRSGELLAMAGERAGVIAPSVTAVTEPFEPGSSLKPLIAAGLLAEGKVRTTDVVPTRNGSYDLHGRTIHDEPHPGPTPKMLSLADVIRFSSNIGIVQFADRLSPREEYETLRDFGIGTPSGLPYVAEAAGTLRPPTTWSKQTMASLAMGYEVAVTPLQLALAYGAIANGGELLEPVLIREIRGADNEIRFHAERRVVRRVMPSDVAKTLRQLLSGVVERGTAVDADMSTFQLAGKTGTPRRIVGGKYAPRQYNPNFVGLFPAEAPQLVIVVRISNPKGDFYGGRTAAPMTKTILEAALAARDAALDRSTLGAATKIRLAAKQQEGGSARTVVAAVGRGSVAPERADSTRSVTLDLPLRAERKSAAPARPVPNVHGLNLRDAVRSLHSAGFRVQLARATPGVLTEPASGALATAGTLVRLRLGR
jgi:cell division protein FtsI (penicillin-binding protein 3)